jgi:hypothetical protein
MNGGEKYNRLPRRLRARIDRAAQVIIFDHMRLMSNLLYNEFELFWDGKSREEIEVEDQSMFFSGFFVITPIIEDYHFLKETFFIEEFYKSTEEVAGLLLIPVPKFYKIKNERGETERVNRDDDFQHQDPRYLIVEDKYFKGSLSGKRFKRYSEKDFGELLLRFAYLHRFNKSMQEIASHFADREAGHIGYAEYLKKAGMQQREIRKWKLKKSPKQESYRQLIIKELFGGNKQNYKKTRQKFRKMGLLL